MASVPSQMRALIKRQEVASYELEVIPTPEPEGDEVLIKVEAVSICGSDIALYHWNEIAREIASLPFIPGHEAAGTVVRLGPEATLKIGDRVAVENHFFCGDCYQCHDGRGDICQDLGQYGHGKKTTQGGCSEYSTVSSKYCYKLNTHISMEEAALLEPLGVAHNAIEQLEVKNEGVLILGAGAIGILACQVAKALGASRVYVADIADERLALAKDLGADVGINVKKENIKDVIHEATSGDGIGRICEITGAPAMVNGMFSMLRKAGRVVMVGLPKEPVHIDNARRDILFKSLTLKTIHGRRIFHTWSESERLIAEDHVQATRIVTHRVAMSDYERAFQALFKGEAIKIVINPFQ